MKIENLRIAELKPDPQNARKHDAANLSAIKASLSSFGQRKPIVVTADNVVAAGNGTLQAAKELGWLEIDIVRIPEDWSDAQIKAFALADNRTAELAEWDADTLAAQAMELEAVGIQLESFGFTNSDLSVFDVVPIDAPNLDSGDKKEIEQITFTLHTTQADVIREAIANAKLNEKLDSSVNANGNANAITHICRMYADGQL
jgi:ParB-like chromosome segregation protein Spo0J